MRFVYLIARLKEDLDECHTRLDDLDDMALELLKEDKEDSSSPGRGTVALIGASDAAMLALIEACEEQAGDDLRRLTSSLAGYEYRRDFRAS